MKRFTSVIFAVLAMTAIVLPSSVLAQASQQESKARVLVAKTGTGEKARVELELNNGTKIKGNIKTIGTDSFEVTAKDTGSVQSVAFADVKTIKNPRSGLKPRTWIIIGAVAVAAIIIGKTVLYPVLCDGGAGC